MALAGFGCFDMALQEQILDVPIVGGLDESEDERLTVKPRTLENCRYRKQGTISKRYGYAVSSSTVSSPTQLSELNGKPVFSSYSQASMLGGTAASSTTFTSITRSVSTGASIPIACDVRKVNGYLITIFAEIFSTTTALTAIQTQAVPIYYKIERDGATIVPKTVLTTAGSAPRLASNGNTVYFVYETLPANQIFVRSLDTTSVTGTPAAAVFIYTAFTGGVLMDVWSDTSSTWYIATVDVTAAATLKVIKMSGTTVSSSFTSATGTVSMTGLAIHVTASSRIWCTVSGNSLTRVRLFDAAGTGAFAWLTVGTFSAHQLSILETSSTAAFFAASAQSGHAFCWGSLTSGGSATTYTGSLVTKAPFFALRSKLLTLNSVQYAVVQTNSESNTTLLVSLSATTGLKVINVMFPGVWNQTTQAAATATATEFVNAPCSFLSTYETLFNVPTSVSTSDVRFSLTHCIFDIAPVCQTISWSGGVVMCGGIPSLFDGETVAELGFIGPCVFTSATAAGAVPAGTYYHKALLAYVNRLGCVKRGYPSDQVSIISAGHSFNLTFPSIYLTNTSFTLFEVFYELYRTTLAAPTTFYRVGPDVPSLNFIGYPDNPITSNTFYGTPNDSSLDTAIETNPLLYTSGGLLPNIQPPSARLGCIFNNRVFLADTHDGTIWYSKTLLLNEFPSFTSAFTIAAPQPGRITAITHIDDKLLIFYDNAIWVITGEGPNDTGAGSSFSTPYRIADGIGCTEFRSVCRTSAGVFFQSRAGIQLLGRDLSISYIGAPVQDIIDTVSSLTSAVDCDEQQEVRFTVNITADVKAKILVYDYQSNSWSKDVFYDSDDYSLDVGGVINGVYYLVRSATQVLTESDTTYLDNGTWVPMTFETGELHVNQIQGMQRVWEAYCLTKRHTAYGLTLTFYNDYSSSSSQSETFAHADVTTAGTVGQFGVTLSEQECQSLRIKITDVEGGTLGTGQGCTITGLTLCIGTEGKITKRVPEAQRK
jgi:hypothetical protein